MVAAGIEEQDGRTAQEGGDQRGQDALAEPHWHRAGRDVPPSWTPDYL
jgi:hypothetical protein